MPSPLSKLALAALALGAVALPRVAGAEPPGLTGAEHHAVGPLPRTYPSPMPSLPPPQHLAPGETPKARREPRPGLQPRVIRRPGFRARVEADGSIHFGGDSTGGGPYADPVQGTGATFRFGLTDRVSRWLGEDPYLAEKLALMDSTRPERVRMREVHQAETMDRAVADLPRYLQAVWSHEAWSARTRRRLLFLLWDEAAERGNPHLREGGARARAIISRFIARNLPPGSPDAYSAEELAALNRNRSSGRPFAPYAEHEMRRARPRIAAAGGLDRILRAF